MTPELNQAMMVLARVLTIYLILEIVTTAATLFLRVYSHFKAESVLKALNEALGAASKK